MEFNPYLPPRSSLGEATTPKIGRAYRVVNYFYAAILLASTGLLLAGFPPPMDRRSLLAVLCFYAPIVCFCLVRWAPPLHTRRFLVVYGAYVLFLVAVAVWNLLSPNADPAIGALIVGTNVLALLGAFVQLTRKSDSSTRHRRS